MRTLRVGSSRPPHSTALVSNSRKAWPTDSRTASGRRASNCIIKAWIRLATSSVHGATSSTHSGRADTTSIGNAVAAPTTSRSEEHTSELQSHSDLVCRLLLEKKKKRTTKERSKYTKRERLHTRT